ncbi:homoserine kinase [Cellulomonas cellasea]|uniref:Homoserine kinase n=1 Tax=Cellulomonas cellasea TaxID=43670 RepID=A0A7W4YBK9_9CELL|nr:homoserine kinase [Cellulomonas cellasea]MBB2923798.1 homoserine kinase [Cellulomonas cellasea]
MRLGHHHVRARVPATSANLGPGFDALGLALGLHDDLEVRALGSPGVVVDVTGEGADSVPRGEDHLVVRALRLALDHVGAPQTGLHLTCTNRIPHGRGLGSSAAAAVGGLLLARALLADPEALDDETVLGLATELEGHPDNAAPALLGGATIAWLEGTDERPRAVRLDLHPDVAPLVVVPATELSTRRARGVLPASVPHGDAARQAGRAALLVEALSRRPDLLLPATSDWLHQPYRRDVMPDSLALVDALRAHGVAAVVSGAGPTVLALARVRRDAAGTAVGTDADGVVDDAFGGVMGGWTVLRPDVDLDGGSAWPVG